VRINPLIYGIAEPKWTLKSVPTKDGEKVSLFAVTKPVR
jgi:hypothetical protein